MFLNVNFLIRLIVDKMVNIYNVQNVIIQNIKSIYNFFSLKYHTHKSF